MPLQRERCLEQALISFPETEEDVGRPDEEGVTIIGAVDRRSLTNGNPVVVEQIGGLLQPKARSIGWPGDGDARPGLNNTPRHPQ